MAGFGLAATADLGDLAAYLEGVAADLAGSCGDSHDLELAGHVGRAAAELRAAAEKQAARAEAARGGRRASG